MEQVDIVRLEEAIKAFYQSKDQATNVWLSEAKVSPQAWQFVWQLMQPDKTQEVQFFGATTLHSKLRKNWKEVTPDSHEDLKQKLVKTLLLFVGGPKLVRSRLSMCLAAYIVHMLVGSDTQPIEEVNNILKHQVPSLTPDVQAEILIEVLEAIPDEAHSVITPGWRTTLHATVGKWVSFVVQSTEDYLKMNTGICSPTNITRAVGCTSAWVKNYNYSLEGCVGITSILLELVRQCYWPCIRDGRGTMSAKEDELATLCLETLASIVVQPFSSCKTTIGVIKMCLDALSDITKAELNRGNESIDCHIYALLVNSMKRHSWMLLYELVSEEERFELLRRIIHELMQCTEKPGIYPVEERCSIKALPFWHVLQRNVLSMPTGHLKPKCLEYIKPVYAHLTRIMVRKSEQPDEKSLEEWTSDDLECFQSYRQEIAKTFVCCYNVLKGGSLEILSGMLDAAISDIQTPWTSLEACIYAFQSVGNHVCDEDSVPICNLMRILSSIPYSNLNVKLLGTAVQAICSFGHWLTENPVHIPLAINLVVCGLQSSMSGEATLGLKKLCRPCHCQLKPYAESLLLVCQSCLNSGYMKTSDLVELMRCIASLLRLIPPAELPKYLNLIVSPCLEELQAICQEQENITSKKSRLVFCLKMISPLFSPLDTGCAEELSEPLLLVMQTAMPIFQRIIEMSVEKFDVLDAVCATMSRAIGTLRLRLLPMIQEICQFISASFRTRCCPATLELCKTVIVVFYEDASCQPVMHQLLRETIQRGFQVFETTPEQSYLTIAEIVEAFFACLAKIVEKVPRTLKDENLPYDRLVFYAQQGFTLAEGGAILASVGFIRNFVKQSWNYAHTARIVRDTMDQTILTSLVCIGSVAPASHVEKFASLFMAYNQKYGDHMAASICYLFVQPNLPMQHLSKDEKVRYAFLISEEGKNKAKLQKYIYEMVLKTRGLAEQLH
ncbi:hypothetical protein KR038_006745 [Drosophila bunnanda]|nr:hypothetical protein KR038_006745 [Drosophila bunnanda]